MERGKAVGRTFLLLAFALSVATLATYYYGVPPATPHYHPLGILVYVYRDYAVPLGLFALTSSVMGLLLTRRSS